MLTQISLEKLNKIFPSYNFTKLTPTLSGIVDTTYIVHTQKKAYILKKYERDIPEKIEIESELLKNLNDIGLNVPLRLDSNGAWHLYKKLKGEEPKGVKSYHIQALARFLAKMHKESLKSPCKSKQKIDIEVLEALNYTKAHFYSYYKRFDFLKEFRDQNDAMIHGDIFKDNTIFDEKSIGVIDFIDSTCGSFVFDVAVALVGFDVKKSDEYFMNIFLRTYNQHAPKKLTKERVKNTMKIASHFYALKRVHKYKNTLRAKELLR